MKFLLLEDDHLQAEAITEALEEQYGRGCVVTSFRTELALCDGVVAVVAARPDMAILDIMVRYTDLVSLDLPAPPEEVGEDGHFRAGIRCAKRLREYLSDLPIILYSVLEESDVREELAELSGVVLLEKNSDPNTLYRAIEQVAGRKP